MLIYYNNDDDTQEIVPGLHYHGNEIFPVNFAVATSEKHYQAELDRLGVMFDRNRYWPKQADGTTTLLESHAGENIIIVGIDSKALKKVDQSEAVGVCAHEAMHTVQMFEELLGEERFGAETEAYLLQWVTGIIWAEHTGKITSRLESR